MDIRFRQKDTWCDAPQFLFLKYIWCNPYLVAMYVSYYCRVSSLDFSLFCTFKKICNTTKNPYLWIIWHFPHYHLIHNFIPSFDVTVRFCKSSARIITFRRIADLDVVFEHCPHRTHQISIYPLRQIVWFRSISERCRKYISYLV